VAVDPVGNAVAVWPQGDGIVDTIWANTYNPVTGWGSARYMETNRRGDARSPQVAVDPSGNAVVVWFEHDGTRYNIWSNTYTAGTGWGNATLIETNDTGSAAYPQVAVDPSGNAVAVWYQKDGTRYNIWANSYTAGTGWGTAEQIETDDAGYAKKPQVAVDAVLIRVALTVVGDKKAREKLGRGHQVGLAVLAGERLTLLVEETDLMVLADDQEVETDRDHRIPPGALNARFKLQVVYR